GSWNLEYLDKSEIEMIHDASLRILSELGIFIDHAEIGSELKKNGVEEKNKRLLFSEDIVKEAVRKSKKKYTLYARNPKYSLEVGRGNFRFLSSAGQTDIVDPVRKEKRKATKKDLHEAILVGDALENINIVGSMANPQEIPSLGRCIYVYSELIKNSSKIVFSWIENPEEAPYVLKMFEVLAGGEEEHRKKPMIWYFCEPVSPLKFRYESLEILRLFCQKGLPASFGPMVMAGLTGPITLAGTLALENAEILAGITIAQILSPGTAVEYGGIPHIADMRNLNISFGSPEQAIMAVAMTQIGRYYGFSVHVNTGLTDSNIPDAQAGLEKGASMLISALAGAEMFGHLGIAGADQGASIEQLIIDNEIAGYVKRVINGFDVNEETLGFDLIKDRLETGSFTGTRHTLKHMKSEQWFPRLLNRDTWDGWLSKNSKDLLTKAMETKQKILKEHSPEPLEKQVENMVKQIVKEASKELTAKRSSYN
ncbi:MAG: trimethylamine methyltransferase family protein, partial [Candidatus Bathyarchaeia archaeon]